MMRLLAALAIVGGTVYTGEGGPIEGATVLIEGNRVAAVGRRVSVPSRARVVDAAGRIITPGLIDASSRLGVVELSQEATSVEGTAGPEFDPVRAALRVVDTYDPSSLAIPVARGGGLTAAVVVPTGGLIAGESVWVDLVERDPVRRSAAALHVSLHAGGKPGARARAFLRLREVLEDARLYRANRGPYIARRLRDLSVSAADLGALVRALEGELPVVFGVNRAADIRTVLGIVREHRLKGVLRGAAEGWRLADEIARARVPVILDPLRNLPTAFESLHTRGDNAILLERAGVDVAFTIDRAPHFSSRLRHVAGNAVARGFPRDAALAAITSVPASIFDMPDEGRLRPGSLANLVIWNGDPFELDTWAVDLYVRGERVSQRSRQDELTERYR